MNGYLSRLNPTERRFVIGVGLVLFLVINIFWIWPHFSDLPRWRTRLDKANRNYATNQIAIREIPRLETELATLLREGNVPPEEQGLRFQQTIQSTAFESGVSFNFPSRLPDTTNQFFIEKAQAIAVVGGEKQLVDFLYRISSGESIIRVRSMSLRREANYYQLNANITLVASYQKKPTATRGAGQPTTTTTRSATPSTTPSTAQPPKPQGPVPTSTKKSPATNAPPTPTKKK
jgi:hypothetical protein